MQFIQLNILWNTDCAENHRTLSHNRGRFYRIDHLHLRAMTLPQIGTSRKSPLMRGEHKGGKIQKTTDLSLL